MWCRVVEVHLGCWLAVSPFIFHPAAERPELWVNDFVSAAVVVTLALASFWRPLRHSHRLLIGVGLWLVGFGYVNTPPGPPQENHIIVGLVLLIVAILPNDADTPPEPWHAWYASPARRGSRGAPGGSGG